MMHFMAVASPWKQMLSVVHAIIVPVVDPFAVALSTSAAEWNMFFLNGPRHCQYHSLRPMTVPGTHWCPTALALGHWVQKVGRVALRRPEMAAKAWHRLS